MANGVSSSHLLVGPGRQGRSPGVYGRVRGGGSALPNCGPSAACGRAVLLWKRGGYISQMQMTLWSGRGRGGRRLATRMSSHSRGGIAYGPWHGGACRGVCLPSPLRSGVGVAGGRSGPVEQQGEAALGIPVQQQSAPPPSAQHAPHPTCSPTPVARPCPLAGAGPRPSVAHTPSAAPISTSGRCPSRTIISQRIGELYVRNALTIGSIIARQTRAIHAEVSPTGRVSGAGGAAGRCGGASGEKAWKGAGRTRGFGTQRRQTPRAA
jgi:hypothetical protein